MITLKYGLLVCFSIGITLGFSWMPTAALNAEEIRHREVLCLISGNTSGDEVYIQKCNRERQSWRISSGDIRNNYDLCLTAHISRAIKRRNRVYVLECNNSSRQNWFVSGTEIRNASGWCLTAPETQGNRVQIQRCNGSHQQAWSIY